MVKKWLIFPQELIVIHEMIGIEKKCITNRCGKANFFLTTTLPGQWFARSLMIDVIAASY
jgi:hypothetical protein